MVERIGPKRPFRLFLAEWREEKGLTQQQLADRLGTTDMTVSRWETGKRKPDINAQAAIAQAMGMDDPIDLYRDPAQPSADALLRGQPPEIVAQAMKLIRAIRQ